MLCFQIHFTALKMKNSTRNLPVKNLVDMEIWAVSMIANQYSWRARGIKTISEN